MSHDAQAAALRHVWHHAVSTDELARDGITFLVDGDGATVRDRDGNEYLDATSILGVTQVGHGRREIADAVAAQITRLEYGSLARGFGNLPATALAEHLAAITPGRLELVWFSCTGSEAVDGAIKIARQYHRNAGHTGRYKVVARHGSYHGATFGALSATGIPAARAPSEPLLPGFVHIAQPYVYRSDTELGCPPEEAGARAADALERQIVAEGPDTVAAFIAEPIAIRQAVKVPPDDYWPRVRQICDRYGVLLIVDEIFNGFGRTGRMFGSDHFGLSADIMVVSKGLTSGYVPLSAVIVTDEVAAAFRGDRRVALAHGGTFSGHPVACAAALANLDVIAREDLVANAARRGTQLRARLDELREHPNVGNIGGVGLLHSVELVADRTTKAPADPALGRQIERDARRHGVLLRFMEPATIYLYPPLVVTERQVTHLADVVIAAAGRV